MLLSFSHHPHFFDCWIIFFSRWMKYPDVVVRINTVYKFLQMQESTFTFFTLKGEEICSSGIITGLCNFWFPKYMEINKRKGINLTLNYCFLTIHKKGSVYTLCHMCYKKGIIAHTNRNMVLKVANFSKTSWK